jgi:zeta-carotene isomerase
MQLWIAPSTGVATLFLEQLEKISTDSTALMLAIFAVFALVHSGLAYLRPYGEQGCSSFLLIDMSPPDIPLQMPQQKDCHVCQCYLDYLSTTWFSLRTRMLFAAGEELIGARAFRVIFAAISLPLATVALVHFINHRYDGLPLWNLRGQPFVHEAVWVLNFVSFFFLYPSTFNLLEVSTAHFTGCLLCKVPASSLRLPYSTCAPAIARCRATWLEFSLERGAMQQ